MESTIRMLLVLGVAEIATFCTAKVTYRPDQVGSAIVSFEGLWGDWSDTVFCDAGQFARGFKLKVEPSQGGHDDSSANSFRMVCDDGEEVSTDLEGSWGTWSSNTMCSSSQYIVAYKVKCEGYQGGDADDTAMNNIRVLCSDDSELEPSNGGPYGTWYNYAQCAARTSVCGFRQRVEGYQGDGSGDDSALNSVELFCCANKKELSRPRGYWSRVIGSGGGGSGTVTSTIGVTKHEESELTDTFAASVSFTASVGMEFEGFSASYELSTSVSTQIAKRSLESVTTTKEEQFSFTCPAEDDAMYQWVTDFTEDAMTEVFEFSVKSKDTWCMSDDALVPQCPFGYCADDDCQACDPYQATVILGPTTHDKKLKPMAFIKEWVVAAFLGVLAVSLVLNAIMCFITARSKKRVQYGVIKENDLEIEAGSSSKALDIL